MSNAVVATVCLLGLLDVVPVPLPVMMSVVIIFLYSKLITG